MGMIEDALRDELGGDAKKPAECDKCERQYPNVEPDAKFECREDDCDGIVKAPLRREGFM